MKLVKDHAQLTASVSPAAVEVPCMSIVPTRYELTNSVSFGIEAMALAGVAADAWGPR